MPLMNRKGLAEVILLVLIILLSLAAVTIFSASLLGPARQLSPQFSCTELRLNQPFQLEESCFDQEKGKINAKVKKSFSGSGIDELTFKASNSNGELEEWSCGADQCSQCIVQQEGSVKAYTLPGLTMADPTLLILEVGECTLNSVDLKPCIN